MQRSALRGRGRVATSTSTLVLLATLVIGHPVHAGDEGPQPDPAGTGTGSRWTVVDASGAPLWSCRR